MTVQPMVGVKKIDAALTAIWADRDRLIEAIILERGRIDVLKRTINALKDRVEIIQTVQAFPPPRFAVGYAGLEKYSPHDDLVRVRLGLEEKLGFMWQSDLLIKERQLLEKIILQLKNHHTK